MTTKDASLCEPGEVRAIWRSPEAWLITLLVLVIYLSRLEALPIAGEEPRWAGCASLMIETGDWIVPRQQGVIYPDRPPLGSWTIALTGLIRGKVDAIAIRLPSVIAIWLTSIGIFAYARGFLSSVGAFAASVAFATGGQVMQLGRLGENEALYTMLLAGSMLVWHWGYWHGWSRFTTWTLGYGLAACAFLVKGPQAPVYFTAATILYLTWRRDWRWLFGVPHVTGIAVSVGLVSLWLVPFYLRTDVDTTLQIIGLSSAARYTWTGFIKHLATYPLETFGCLLPWSVLVLGIGLRRMRQELGKVPMPVVFLLTAAAVTYPSVWLASGARGRYFMPLYPCLAIALGWIADRLAHSIPGSLLRKLWNLALTSGMVAATVAGLTIPLLSILPATRSSRVGQPIPDALIFCIAGLLTSAALYWSMRHCSPRRAQAAVLAMAAFAGVAHTQVMINAQLRIANDLTEPIAQIKRRLKSPGAMVSFGAADHRFCYYYGSTIKELPWPTRLAEVPADVTYFCFTRFPTDTPEKRTSGRFWNWTTTSGTLPFEWEEIAVISCDRKRSATPLNNMVVGRIIRSPSSMAQEPPHSGSIQR